MPAVNIRVELGELRAIVSHLSEGVLDDTHFSVLVGTVCDSIWRPNQPFQMDYIGAFSSPSGNGREWSIKNAGQQRQIVIAVEHYLKAHFNIQGISFTDRLMQRNVNLEFNYLQVCIIVARPTLSVAL